jgi:hypothetical protein
MWIDPASKIHADPDPQPCLSKVSFVFLSYSLILQEERRLSL